MSTMATSPKFTLHLFSHLCFFQSIACLTRASKYILNDVADALTIKVCISIFEPRTCLSHLIVSPRCWIRHGDAQ